MNRHFAAWLGLVAAIVILAGIAADERRGVLALTEDLGPPSVTAAYAAPSD